MKKTCSILFALLYAILLHAQDSISLSSKTKDDTVFSFRIKIQMQQATITGTLVGIADSFVSVIADTLPWRIKKSRMQPAFVNVQQINASQIQWIQVQRNSFVTGICIGVVAGFGAGYLAGSITYKNDDSKTSGENDESRKENGIVIGAIGALPGAIIGAITGSISSRKKFRIDYKSENLHALQKALYTHNNL